MRVALALALWLVAATAAGDEPTKILVDGSKLPPGTYHLLLTVEPDGSVSLVRLPVRLFTLSGVTGPEKPEGPEKPPPDPTGLAAKAAALAIQVSDPTRAKTAKAIAAIYRSTAGLVGEGITTQSQLKMATNLLYNAALRAVDKTRPWKDWKAGVDGLVEAADFDDVEAQAVGWLEIAAGMEGVE